jgi:hypothetical protein
MRLLSLTFDLRLSIPSLFSLSNITSLFKWFRVGKEQRHRQGLSNPSASHFQIHHTHMAPSVSSPPLTDARILAINRAVSLIEVSALVAAFSGLVGVWRLLGVCRGRARGEGVSEKSPAAGGLRRVLGR